MTVFEIRAKLKHIAGLLYSVSADLAEVDSDKDLKIDNLMSKLLYLETQINTNYVRRRRTYGKRTTSKK